MYVRGILNKNVIITIGILLLMVKDITLDLKLSLSALSQDNITLYKGFTIKLIILDIELVA